MPDRHRGKIIPKPPVPRVTLSVMGSEKDEKQLAQNALQNSLWGRLGGLESTSSNTPAYLMALRKVTQS